MPRQQQQSRFGDYQVSTYKLCGLSLERDCSPLAGIDPFRTAVPFWGQTSQISSSFVPKRDRGSKGVKRDSPCKLFLYVVTDYRR